MNIEKRKEYYRNYYENHKDKYKKYHSDYYMNHIEEIKEKRDKWIEDNPEYQHDYYETNKDKYKENHQKWRENNKERWVELCSNSRRKRAERLREQGYEHPYSIINKTSKEIEENE